MSFRLDFAAEIRSNKRKSALLFFSLPILLIALCWAIGQYYGYDHIGLPIGALVAVAVMVITFYLGDDIILGFTGAREADYEKDQMLINVVDEMRIAAGLPMPRVYVIDSFAMNAFATGWDHENAALGVTRGMLEKLNRDELQGVVGHEMAHIANLDIRYMLLVTTLVGAIALISDGFRRSLWFGSGRTGRAAKGGMKGPFMILAIMLAILAPLSAMIIQMSISRKREYLADATSARLTRNPVGLASALQKLQESLFVNPLPWINRGTAHLFIVNPLRNDEMEGTALFSTHPPTKDRIARLNAMAAISEDFREAKDV